MAEDSESKANNIRDAYFLLNKLFETAKIDVQVIDLAIYKEEVIIAVPQLEGYESELASVNEKDGIENGARYLAAGSLSTQGRQVEVYIRFYLQSDGSLKIEGSQSDNVTVQSDEADKPDRWKGALENAEHWGPTIVQIILAFLGKIKS